MSTTVIAPVGPLIHRVDKLVNGVVALAERFEDPDPGGVPKGAEEL